MKTFTTYAEKKAKQFLNLLQGYTKGIRITAILILLLMGVGNASAVDLYLRGIISWDCWNDNHLVDRGNNIQSTYVSLTANTNYTFKVGDSNWNDNYNYGKNGNNTLSLGHEYKMAKKGGDLSFKPTETGVYLFSVNTSSWGLTITRVIPTTAAPAEVVNGINKMFYIEGYAGLNYLLNSSKGKASTSYPLSYMGTSYVNTAATNLTQYYYISNNPSGWVGEANTNIKSAKGGELFSHTSKTAAKTASTTPSISGNTLNISTTTNATTGVYGSLKLYIQYYINNDFTGVTYNSSTASYASIPAGGQTARTSTFDVSNLESGTYTLNTILTDGIIYYIADTDEFTVTNTRTITFGVKDGGGKVAAKVEEEEYTSSPISVEDGTKITFTATPDANNVFSKWVNGSGTQISTKNPYSHTVSSDATIKAVFLKPTTIYLKPSSVWKHANARFAVYWWKDTKNGWIDMTAVGCNDEYYMADVPAGVTNFKFCRMNPATTENNFNNNNRWAETGNLTIPNDGKNLFDMTQMYLDAKAGWRNDNARFAAYFYVKDGGDGKTKWMSMSYVKDDIYKCDIPSDHNFDWVIFCRMNGEQSTNNWDNKWNQTSDLELTSSNYTHGNYFTITKFENGNTEGSWSWNDIAWTKLDLPKITITNSDPTDGDVVVKTTTDAIINSGQEVPFDTKVIVTLSPKAGYAVNSATITTGNTTETITSGKQYTICANTTITVSFKEQGEWYIVGLEDNEDSWKNPNDKYKFVDGRVLVKLDGKVNKMFKIASVSGGSIGDQYGHGTFKGLYPSFGLSLANNSEGGDHSTIETVHDGNYLFMWDENNKILTIEYPNVCFLHGNFNDWHDKAPHALHDRDAQVYLTASVDNYKFKVVEKGIYYTSSTSSVVNASGTKTMDDSTDGAKDCEIKATVTGIYKFHFDKETRVLTIIYPEDKTLANGDYRLKFVNGENDHVSDHVKKGDGQDIVSMFITKAGTEPKIILQRYNSGTWNDITTDDLSAMSTVTSDQEMTNEYGGVWNFIIKQTNGGADAEVIIDETHPERYTGNYYIRTDAAGGGWNEYMIPENVMPFASYPRDNGKGFDHYFCEWILNGSNVNYNIANDYCSKLCPNDYTKDDYTTNEGHLQADANVRFMWDSRTNNMKGRAYLSGASTPESRFLVLQGDAYLKDADGKNFEAGTDDNGRKGLGAHEAILSDKQNWVYQLDVKASSNTYVKLIAKYRDIDQYFEGGATETIPLIKANSNTEYKIRLIYNFKTDHLVRAWLAGGETITGDETLGTDMMLIRRDQNPADQLRFNPNTTRLSDVQTAFAVTTFSKGFITDESISEYDRALYWISFPFQVKLSEAFGFGEYGIHWIMQRYRGDLRAEKGLFSDSGTYWEYIMDPNTVLNPGFGYVLTLDLDLVKQSFLHDAQEVSLYFPSVEPLKTIDGTLPASVEIPKHTCEIPYGTIDHRITDSHWNMIGVPGFVDIEDIKTDEPLVNTKDVSFYYEYLSDNTYQATNKTADFQTMYGYMVQYAGIINWEKKAFEGPAEIAARRNSESNLLEKVSMRLELAQGEEKADQTFVQLQQEGATTDFDMNIDLTKIINNGANIYTLTNDRIQAAGNAVPMEEALVPVGVQIAAEGEYTFRMPDGTEGMVVELVDYETNTRTNLLLSDYTVTLQKGSNENRFALHIQPQKDVVTSLENIGEGVNNGKAVNKYLIDGKLIIRTAEGIFDAQGHRL